MVTVTYVGWCDSCAYQDASSTFAELALAAREESKSTSGPIVVKAAGGMSVVAEGGTLRLGRTGVV